jgi:hypothetical protein
MNQPSTKSVQWVPGKSPETLQNFVRFKFGGIASGLSGTGQFARKLSMI